MPHVLCCCTGLSFISAAVSGRYFGEAALAAVNSFNLCYYVRAQLCACGHMLSCCLVQSANLEFGIQVWVKLPLISMAGALVRCSSAAAAGCTHAGCGPDHGRWLCMQVCHSAMLILRSMQDTWASQAGTHVTAWLQARSHNPDPSSERRLWVRSALTPCPPSCRGACVQSVAAVTLGTVV